MSAVIEKIKNLNEAAIAAKKAGDIEEAIQLLKDALKIESHPTTYLNLGIMYFAKEDYCSAVEVFRRIKPPYPEKFAFYFYYGRALAETQCQDLAIPFLEKALALDKNSAYSQSALAYCYFFIGEYEKAEVLYKGLLSQIDTMHEEYFRLCKNYFFSCLASQNWEEAKKIDKLFSPEDMLTIDNISLRVWHGEYDEDKAIFIVSDEGVGDDISYSAYISCLENKFKKIFFECDPRLITWFEKNHPGVEFVNKFSLIDRKKALRNCHLANFSYQISPYFLDEPKRKKFLPLTTKKFKFDVFTIGVSYSSTAKDAFRRMPNLSFWEKVFETFPNVNFINLQDNKLVKQEAKFFLDHHPRVKKISGVDLYNDFEKLAEVINACDYIISIDNTIAHIAGRLEKKSAVLLSTGCDWRWCNEKFYPSVAKIQQKNYGGWETVFDELAQLILP